MVLQLLPRTSETPCRDQIAATFSMYIHMYQCVGVRVCVWGDCGRLSLQSFSANYGETDKVSIL